MTTENRSQDSGILLNCGSVAETHRQLIEVSDWLEACAAKLLAPAS